MPEAPAGIPPWHMWGNAQTVTVDAELLDPHSAAPPPNPPQQQLIKVAYGRPENWRFLFWMKVLDASPQAILDSANTSLVLWFNVAIGVGRAQVELTKFALFQVRPLAPFAVTFTPRIKYVSAVLAPQQEEDDPSPAPVPPRTVVDHLVAQDIQVRFQALFGTSVPPAPNTNITVEGGCFFAPNVHVRPEWMARVGVFPGGEASGK